MQYNGSKQTAAEVPRAQAWVSRYFAMQSPQGRHAVQRVQGDGCGGALGAGVGDLILKLGAVQRGRASLGAPCSHTRGTMLSFQGRHAVSPDFKFILTRYLFCTADRAGARDLRPRRVSEAAAVWAKLASIILNLVVWFD